MSAERKTVGAAFVVDQHDVARCPMCLADLTDELIPGYGLAYGGGPGTYWYCTNETCDWFYKILDAPEEASA